MDVRRRNTSGSRVLGYVIVAGLALLVLKWLLITAVLLAVPFGIWWAVDRYLQARRGPAAAAGRRAELEALAVVDAGGGCGWCGSRVAHRSPDGRIVLPAAHHRADIDAAALTPA